MLRAVSLFVLIGLALAKNEIYDGQSLYEISVQNPAQIQLVNDITSALDLDVWSHALPGRPGQVLVRRQQREQLENELSEAGVEYKIETEDIKEMIDLEERLLAEAKNTSPSRNMSLPFNTIHTYAEVMDFLRRLASTYPSVVTLVNGGSSFQGRDLLYVRISSTNFQDTRKPVIYMQSLLHAREWITLPAILFALDRLVINVVEPDLLRDFDWIIMPVANPDGYVHTHVSTRFWRKNRNNSYGSCIGVDLNRNFNVNWGTASSNNACSDTFHGRAAYSEPETVIIRNIMRQFANRKHLSLDIHSFGSMILYGWGNGTLPSNGLYLNLLGVRMANAIDAVKMSWNPNYIVGNVVHVLYQASGSAGDYPLTLGVPYSYTFELPGLRSQSGLNGFLVDATFIQQAGFETWEGIKAGARYLRDNRNYF